jgi:hypothetical protein
MSLFMGAVLQTYLMALIVLAKIHVCRQRCDFDGNYSAFEILAVDHVGDDCVVYDHRETEESSAVVHGRGDCSTLAPWYAALDAAPCV